MPVNTHYVSPQVSGDVSDASPAATTDRPSASQSQQPAGVVIQDWPWKEQIARQDSGRFARSATIPPTYDPNASYRHGDSVAINGNIYTPVASGSALVKGVAPEGAGAVWGRNPWWRSGRVQTRQATLPQQTASPSGQGPSKNLPAPPRATGTQTTTPMPSAPPRRAVVGNTRWTYPAESPSSTSMQASHPQMYARSEAVFKVNGHPAQGTAFRLGPNNLFMTNAHVIPTDPRNTKYELIAGFEDDPSGKGVKTPVTVRVDKVLFRSDRYMPGPGGGMDAVVFSIDPRDYQSGVLNRFGYLGIDASPLQSGQRVYMPNHSFAGPKRIAYRDSNGAPATIERAGTNQNGKLRYFTHGFTQAGGASGSPVIDANTHEVVGLNHSGMNGDNPPGGSGTTMHTLFPHIAHLFPDGKPPQGSPLPSAQVGRRGRSVLPDIHERSEPERARTDFQTWLKHVAPGCWDASRVYRPGDQVICAGKVYQAPNVGGTHQGVPPGTDDSKWLYHGTVDANYRYYVNHGAALPPQPAVGVDAKSEAKGEQVDALHRLRVLFDDAFEDVGNYLRQTGAPGVRVYGGSNAHDRSALDFDFGAYEKTLALGEHPLQQGKFAQFIYLRPEDKHHPDRIDPDHYRVVTDAESLNIRGREIDLDATTIVPKDWPRWQVPQTHPDYGYLYVPAYETIPLGVTAEEKKYDFLIKDSHEGEYVARYEG